MTGTLPVTATGCAACGAACESPLVCTECGVISEIPSDFERTRYLLSAYGGSEREKPLRKREFQSEVMEFDQTAAKARLWRRKVDELRGLRGH
jgi:hypothetical protein